MGIFRAEVLTNKGDTEDPYTRDDVVAKFHEVADPALGQTRAKALVAAALSLDTAPSLLPLLQLGEVP